MRRLLPLALILALAGCNMFGGGSHSTAPLIADSRSPISDVPVPAGFSMTGDSTSRLVPGSSLRVVDHHYTGSDELLVVVNFYKDQLPKKDWPFVDLDQMGKEVILHFTKRNEDCHVYVSKHLIDTQIRVKIDPLAKS